MSGKDINQILRAWENHPEHRGEFLKEILTGSRNAQLKKELEDFTKIKVGLTDPDLKEAS